MKVVGNSQYQKIANAFLILDLLRKGELARVAIARELGLQPSTVTYSINRLIDANLVMESEKQTVSSSALGRKAVILELNRNFGRVIGLELLADYCWTSVLDPCGTVLHSERFEYAPIEETDPQARFKALVVQAISAMVEKCEGLPILGVGIAIPGIVESEGWEVRDCWTHALKGSDFSDFLKTHFEFPVVLENDANCCAQRYLWEKTQDTFLYLLAREYPLQHVPQGVPPFGIGLGLVFEGKLYRGSHSKAGEFISAQLESASVERQLKADFGAVSDLQHDQDVRKSVLSELVANLRSIVSVLDPQKVYLGGFLSDYSPEVLEQLPLELNDRIIFANAHTDASEGAAMHVLSLVFRIPQVGESGGWSDRWSHLLSSQI